MYIYWNVIYWCNFVCGSILNTFFQRYWRTGHYSLIQKILQAIKNLIKMLLIMGVLGGIAILVIYFWMKGEGINSGKAMLLILSNMYGLLILVLLLGFGLFQVPISIWKRTS